MGHQHRFMKYFIPTILVQILFLGLSHHILAEAGQTPVPPPGFSTGTKDGKSTLRVNLFGQGMAQYLFVDSGTKSLQLKVAAARVVLSGQATNPKTTYLGSFDFAGSNGDGTPTFIDLYFGYAFSEKLNIRAGFFKVPFSRLNLTADEETAFAAFNTNLNKFSLGRDVGFNFFGILLGNHLEYNVFAFNGKAGSFSQANGDSNLEWIFGTRVNGHILGQTKYSEMDWENSSPQLTFGVAGVFDPKTTFSNASANAAKNKLFHATSDLTFQFRHFTLIGAYHFVHNVSNKKSTNGFEGLLTYFLHDNKILLAMKAAGHMPRQLGGYGDGPLNNYETGLAMTYFFDGPQVKLVGDYSAEVRESSLTTKKLTDHRVRLLLQVWL